MSITTNFADDDKAESKVDIADTTSDSENKSIGHSPSRRASASRISVSPSAALAPAKTPSRPKRKMHTNDSQPA